MIEHLKGCSILALQGEIFLQPLTDSTHRIPPTLKLSVVKFSFLKMEKSMSCLLSKGSAFESANLQIQLSKLS